MFEAENITLWRDADIIDPKGDKIGTLESVYVDTTTDQPSFAGVKTGMLGRHRLVFVPLSGAVVGPKYVRVLVDKDQAKNAPGMEVEGELSAEQEPAIFSHYGLPFDSAAGVRRLARR